MNILGKEKKTQLYFRDDNKFQFIKRELIYSCLVERASGALIRAWKHFYGAQLFFPGYKRMSADSVTLGFSRDIILDPFNKIPSGESAGEKPNIKNKLSLGIWIAKIAENQRHTYRSKRKSTAKEDVVNLVLVGVLLIMVVAWVIKFAAGVTG